MRISSELSIKSCCAADIFILMPNVNNYNAKKHEKDGKKCSRRILFCLKSDTKSSFCRRKVRVHSSDLSQDLVSDAMP